MKMKVTTLSPVHIGTGEIIPPICYHMSGGTLYRYSLEQVFQSLSPNTLLDTAFLNTLTSAGNKGDLFKQITPKTYATISPMYRAIDNGKYLNNGRESVSEQMKSLVSPIIPGSSLKGAIKCALIYSFIHKHIKDSREHIIQYFQYSQNSENKDESFFLEMVFGKEIKEGLNVEEFFKNVCGGLVCRDILFSSIGIFKGMREHVENSNKTTPLGLFECICSGEKSVSPQVFSVSTFKKNQLLDAYPDPRLQGVVNHFLDFKSIIKAINLYISEVIHSDEGTQLEGLFEDLDSLDHSFSLIKEEIKKTRNSESEMIIRIGKNTSYFYKSLSWLFKSHFPELFCDSRTFQKFFKPNTSGKNKEINPETLPVTRPVAQVGDKDQFFGFIKVELC